MTELESARAWAVALEQRLAEVTARAERLAVGSISAHILWNALRAELVQP